MAEVTVRYEDHDMGLEELMKRVGRLRRTEAEVGFHEPGPAQVAAYQEFGTSRIPARPFMRAAFAANLSKYKKMQQRLAALLIVGRLTSLSQGLRTTGKAARDDIRAQIASDMGPANVKDRGIPGTLQVTGAMGKAVKVKLR